LFGKPVDEVTDQLNHLLQILQYKGHLKLILTYNVHYVKIQTLTERNQNKIQATDVKYLRNTEEKTKKGQAKKTKLRGRSPQTNYNDRATAACRES
jgi:hypothetical protein